MRNWFLPSSLFDREPALGGGSDTLLDDPGSPYEHGVDEPEPVKTVEKSDTEKRLEALERENADWKRRAEESERDAKFWSDRAKVSRPAVEEREDPEPEVEEPNIKGEDLLDDLSKRGLDALKAGGLITRSEVAKILKEQEVRTAGQIAAARQDAEFGLEIASEFPEIAEDSKRLERGESPKSELFKRTGEIYRAAALKDPVLKGTNSLLLIAARQAKAELDAKAKPKEREPVTNDEPRNRRERIARQMPERGAAHEESEGDTSFSSEQLEVMKRLGVKPEEFRKNTKKDGKRGR